MWPLGESRICADASIGHFRIGDPGSSGLTLAPDARQLVLLEAKLFNRLSSGVKNAPFFDQAAREAVACMADFSAARPADPRTMDDLAFLVLAPQARIDDGVFARDTAIESIRAKEQKPRSSDTRREARPHQLSGLVSRPTLVDVVVQCLAWEEVSEPIAFHDPATGQAIDAFYGKCLPLQADPPSRSRLPRPQSRLQPPVVLPQARNFRALGRSQAARTHRELNRNRNRTRSRLSDRHAPSSHRPQARETPDGRPA